MLKNIEDKKCLEIKYYASMGKKCNIDNPSTFNEKLQWLKLYNRKQDYSKMVDKYEVKKYVAEKIGEEYIVPTIGIYDKFKDINFEILPKQFVIKATHDSGSLVICEDKEKINYKVIKKKINKALSSNYYFIGREWPYKNVEPRIIIEKYLKDFESESIKDYKLMCFNGKVLYTFVCVERFSTTGVKMLIYDREWNKMNFSRPNKYSNEEVKQPANYRKMIEIAEILAKDIPFIRVDFYEIKDKLYFGELTFFPAGGFEKFEPEEYDKILGDMLELPKEKREEK